MPLNKQIRHLQRLMKRYLLGKATRSESEFLEKWYDHFDAMPGDDMDEATSRERDRVLLEAMNRRIDRSERGRVRSLYTHRVWRVAAALLVMVGMIWYFGIKGSGGSGVKLSDHVPVHVGRQDKAPGGDKAVLTLANGQEIVLGAGQGGGMRQGSAAMILVDSVSVSYRGAVTAERGALSKDMAMNTLATPRGGQFRLVLADGTRVWLNSTSVLKYPERFVGDERVVALTGEAYFEVVQDARHPFFVKTPDMEIKVLGTRFDVMAYANEPQQRTTLVEGAVRFSRGMESGVLKPGEQVLVDKGEVRVGAADVDAVLAWKEGKFRFVNADIQTIMRQIARWYDIEVEYKGALPAKRLSGAFPRKQNVSNLFEALEDACDAHFTMEGNTVVVTKK